MVRRGDVHFETVAGDVTKILKWGDAERVEVNGQLIGISQLILDNLPPDVKDAIIPKLTSLPIDPGFKIQIFLDLKVKVVRE